MADLLPVTDPGASDSATLDNALELLLHTGRPLAQCMMMLIPEAWQHHATMSQAKKDFYAYHACLMEPWDGPAAIAFTDGISIGAVLDRNGLRPSRYTVTLDGRVIMASETGVLPVDPGQCGRIKAVWNPAGCFSWTWSRAASSRTRRSRKAWPPAALRPMAPGQPDHQDDLPKAAAPRGARPGGVAGRTAALRLHR
jgi:hypothetical protein